jgi:hypothetical protein
MQGAREEQPLFRRLDLAEKEVEGGPGILKIMEIKDAADAG